MITVLTSLKYSCDKCIISLSILALCCTMASCHKNTAACPNSLEVKANFVIQEICPNCSSTASPEFISYTADTNFGGWVQFKAVLDNAQYEWHIGSDTYTTQAVQINFESAPDNSVIPIELIVHKTPDHNCFPIDDGIDTVTRYMIIDRKTRTYFGKWQGSYSDDPSHTSIVTISGKYMSAYYDTEPFIYGLQPYSDTMANGNSYWNFRNELHFEFQWGVFPNMYGRALVDSTNNNIQIYYWWYGAFDSATHNYTKIFKTFNGKRL